MTEKEKKTDLGTIRIHNEVIAAITSLAAGEVRGVAEIAEGILPKRISRFLGRSDFTGRILQRLSRKGFDRSIGVEVGDKEVKISVSIVAEYGVNIPDVAKELQENIKKSVEKLTGLSPTEVNINVQGISMPKEGKEGVKNENTQ